MPIGSGLRFAFLPVKSNGFGEVTDVVETAASYDDEPRTRRELDLHRHAQAQLMGNARALIYAIVHGAPMDKAVREQLRALRTLLNETDL